MWRRLRQERRKESTLGREASLTPVVYSVVRGDGNRTGRRREAWLENWFSNSGGRYSGLVEPKRTK